jgi:hypothetical protein
MAKKPGTNPKGEFVFFDVVYEDLIASGGRLDFSAISRSCPMMKPRAGSSFSRPPSKSAGTRRLERESSSTHTSSPAASSTRIARSMAC